MLQLPRPVWNSDLTVLQRIHIFLETNMYIYIHTHTCTYDIYNMDLPGDQVVKTQLPKQGHGLDPWSGN